MARIPKISIQGWTADGPAYTIHRTLAGWRHRRARREQRNANELVGPHPDLPDAELDAEVGAAFMVFAIGEVEVQAFRVGHVYEATLLVDGDAINALVDAREDHVIQEYAPGITLLEWRVLEGEELDAAIENGPSIPSNVSDPSESQEPIVSLTGAQVEEISETAALLDAALTPGTPEHEQVVANIAEIATEIADVPLTDATVVQIDGKTIGATPDLEISDEAVEGVSAIVEALADELSDDEPSGSEDGRFEELEAKFAADQITDAELDELAALQEVARAAATIEADRSSTGDDEDAVGGADVPGSGEEE